MRTHHDIVHARPPGPWVAACTAALLGILLALSGCAVGPNFVKHDAAVNENWSQQADPRLATQAGTDSAWWRAFNDPTLDTLIQHAYRQNLPLQVSGLRIMEARAQLAIAVGRQWPQVQAAFGAATGVGISEHSPTGKLVPDRNFWDYQAGFDAAWELDFWRKYGRNVQAERARYLASVADYDNALVSLTAEVARAYAVIRTFEALIDLSRQNVVLQEEGLRIAESRFRNGATSELDVTQATTLLESTRATIPLLESGLIQGQNALSTLLGQPTGAVQAMLGGAKVIPSAPSVVSVSVPADLLRRRPDIRSAELYAASQCARIGVAKADFYPSISLVGQIGSETTTGITGGSTLGNFFGAGSFFYSFGPRIFWPLFNYGRIRNNVRVQDARFQQLLVEYDNAVLKAAQEVEDGIAGFLKAQEAAAASEKAAAGAQRSVELSMLQYREGAVDYQRVLDAQRSLLQEQTTLTRTRSSIATNLISLYKALGGGWELRKGQPVVPQGTQDEMKRRTNWGDMLSTPPAPETSNGSTPTDR